MRRFVEITIVIVALIGLAGCIQLSDSQDFIKYNVLIETLTPTPFGMGGSVGSGVVISKDGLVITAGHVFRGAVTVRITLHDGRVFDVNDFYVDEELDVGFVDLSCVTEDYVELSDSEMVEDGEGIIGIGNPGVIRVDVKTKGKVFDSHFNRLFLHKTIAFLLAVMPVEPGFSGGGVYVDNNLVGIMAIKIDDFAIMVPSNACKQALERYQAQIGGN